MNSLDGSNFCQLVLGLLVERGTRQYPDLSTGKLDSGRPSSDWEYPKTREGTGNFARQKSGFTKLFRQFSEHTMKMSRRFARPGSTRRKEN